MQSHYTINRPIRRTDKKYRPLFIIKTKTLRETGGPDPSNPLILLDIAIQIVRYSDKVNMYLYIIEIYV